MKNFALKIFIIALFATCPSASFAAETSRFDNKPGEYAGSINGVLILNKGLSSVQNGAQVILDFQKGIEPSVSCEEACELPVEPTFATCTLDYTDPRA